VAQWDVDLSDEVVRWYVGLSARDRAYADRALDRLVSTGAGLRMPRSRALGDGLHELRFTCEGVSRRITYAFGEGREVTALTTFRKQHERERHEIGRAHRALARARAQDREIERSR
jgi:hypothetical protein